MVEERVFPEVLTMAVTAVRQHAAVNVIFLMALITVLRLSGKLTPVPMALVAIHCEVNAFKREAAMEISRHFPAFFDVAVRTAIAKFTFVYILMAAATFARHWLVPNRSNRAFTLLNRMSRDGLVAFSTLHVDVFMSKFEITLFIVIERRRLPFCF
jgi:hypothetical protein